jgi:hypothetical protein
MPVVPYYLGRPARTWIASTPGTARAASPAGPRPAARTARRGTPEETGSCEAPAEITSAWQTWASHWFLPRGRA